MPLDSARALTVTEAVNDQFAEIGHVGPTAMPRGPRGVTRQLSVKELAAWEYHWASHLLRIAETRRKKAHAAAVKAGVIFDHEKHPMAVGTSCVVYPGSVVEISVTVAAPIEQFSLPGFMADLAASKLVATVLRTVRRLVGRNTSEARPAHSFKSTLVTR